MPRPTDVVGFSVATNVSLTPGSVTNAATADLTATVKGLYKGRPVHVWCESLPAGLGITNEHCSALNTLKFRVMNPTISPVDLTTQTYKVIQF